MKSLHEDSSWESQGVTDRRRKARSVLAVSALLVAVAAQAAFGQSVMGPLPDGAPPAITTQIDAEGSEAPVTSSLTLIDLDELTKNDWKMLGRDRLHAVRSRDHAIWRSVASDVVYLTRYYGDRVDFDRAALSLMNRYVFEKDESDRLLALAAMHAIGHHDKMARLARRVRLERSPKVKRLTTAAVNDYFNRLIGLSN